MVSFKDLTLREGSQVPGLEIGDATGRRVLDYLAALNVSCVEISFPRAHEREGWYRHAEELGLRTAALARAVPSDVDAALAVDPDEVEVIVNTSDRQLEYALGKTRAEAHDLLVENTERAVDGGVHTGVTLMDAMRADHAFLRDLARAAVDAGAKHVTLADTTGSGTPETVSKTTSAVVDALDGTASVSIHTHDDMGVATANAAAGVDAGAEKVDATVGGIGERAGNAPLEEIAVLLSERGEDIELALNELVPTCRCIHDTLGVDVPPGKPILGEQAYRHESGMHTAAMLRDPATYEPFDPDHYGGDRQLLFGRDTGRGAIRALFSDVGIEPSSEAVDGALEAIRDAATEKGRPFNEDEARAFIKDLQ